VIVRGEKEEASPSGIRATCGMGSRVAAYEEQRASVISGGIKRPAWEKEDGRQKACHH
jgi:hypothetical protein